MHELNHQNKSRTRRLSLVVAVALLVMLALPAVVDHHGAAASLAPVGKAGSAPSFADVAEQAMPAVVNISTTQKIDGRAGGPGWPLPAPEPRPYGEDDALEEFFRRYFGERPPSIQRRSLGSGFIISLDGYIITNSHVISNAEQIIVRLSKPRAEEYEATVVGIDELTDIALIKISAPRALPALIFGSSASLRVGEWVVAVGNPFGLEQTVTVGIVSGKGRVIGAGPYDDFIQTDASINPGNSGGPLLNLRGEVVGINTAIFSRTGGNIGIGFAIPMDQAKTVIAQLKATGKVTRGWLGLSIQAVTPEIGRMFQLDEARGALVTEIAKGGPAQEAGIRRGDILTEFDGVAIKESHELPALVARTAVGKRVKLKVLRAGAEKPFIATVAELPSPQAKPLLPEMRVSRWGFVVAAISPEVARRYRLEWEQKGVVVTAVEPASPAEFAGLRHGDVIEELDRESIGSLAEFDKLIARSEGRDAVLLFVRRGDSAMYHVLHKSKR